MKEVAGASGDYGQAIAPDVGVESAPHVLISVDASWLAELVVKESYVHARQLFLTYVFSLTRYAIDHGGKATELHSAVVATRAVLDTYRRIKALRGDENEDLERVVALDASGKLEDWVASSRTQVSDE